jgi:hypothetical protein
MPVACLARLTIMKRLERLKSVMKSSYIYNGKSWRTGSVPGDLHTKCVASVTGQSLSEAKVLGPMPGDNN